MVLQVGLSLVLLVGAGLFLQSLRKLESKDLKLDARNRYIVHINPQAAGYSQTQLEALYRTMEDRFHALPGVMKVGIASYSPMENNNNGWDVQVQGQPFLPVMSLSHSCKCGVFRFGRNARGNGPRHRHARYVSRHARGSGEPGIREEVIQSRRKSDRTSHWIAGTEFVRRF